MCDFEDLDEDLITSSSCRLCLKNIGSHSIFESNENEITLAEMLISIAATDFPRDNGSPETVCLSCATRINNCYSSHLICEILKIDFAQSSQIVKRRFVEQSFDVEIPKPIQVIIIKDEEEDAESEIVVVLLPGEETANRKECEVVEQKTAKKTFKCDQCDKHYSGKQHLKDHQNLHTGKVFPCEKCDETFTTKLSLKKHNDNKHLGIRKYKCIVCTKEFYYTSHYKNHMRTHTNDKPFKCNQCDKTYKYNESLINHSYLHGETPYKCKQCTEAFNKKKDLLTHLEVVHGIKRKSFECSHCPKKYSSNQSLKDHMNLHSGTGFMCDICGNVFMSKALCRRHSLIHTRTRTNNSYA